MKYVSFLFAVALIGLAVSANATEEKSLSFDYSSQEAYYACSYAETRAAEILNDVGAENVALECFGGIQDHVWAPISLDAVFTHGEKGARTIVLKGRESCDFNVKLIKTILSTIDHEMIKAHSSCWGPTGSYRFEVNLK